MVVDGAQQVRVVHRAEDVRAAHEQAATLLLQRAVDRRLTGHDLFREGHVRR